MNVNIVTEGQGNEIRFEGVTGVDQSSVQGASLEQLFRYATSFVAL